MPSIFAPTTPRRESILCFASEGTGKTTAWMEIAAKTSNTFFHLDSDNAYHANITDFPELADQQDRFRVYEPYDWDDYRKYASEIVLKAQENDWVCVDRMDPMREACKVHFIEQIYGQGSGQWVLEVLKEKQKKNLRGSEHTEIPWSQINSSYYSLITYIHRKSKAHVFWSAGAKKLIYEGMMMDDSKIIDRYDKVKYKPHGGNDLGYIPHTILFMSKGIDDIRRLTTVKDRGRKSRFLDAAEMPEEGGFMMKYMIPVAGWRPKRI